MPAGLGLATPLRDLRMPSWAPLTLGDPPCTRTNSVLRLAAATSHPAKAVLHPVLSLRSPEILFRAPTLSSLTLRLDAKSSILDAARPRGLAVFGRRPVCAVAAECPCSCARCQCSFAPSRRRVRACRFRVHPTLPAGEAGAGRAVAAESGVGTASTHDAGDAHPPRQTRLKALGCAND
eukprot:6173310-Pleurochrysis_carterae.AAC.2